MYAGGHEVKNTSLTNCCNCCLGNQWQLVMELSVGQLVMELADSWSLHLSIRCNIEHLEPVISTYLQSPFEVTYL